MKSSTTRRLPGICLPVLLTLFSCGARHAPQPQTAFSAGLLPDSASSRPYTANEQPLLWRYDTTAVDEGRSLVYVATILSEESNGPAADTGSRGALRVWNYSGSKVGRMFLPAGLSLSREIRSVRMWFDEDAPVDLRAFAWPDEPNILEISAADTLVARLQRAKRLKMLLPLNNAPDLTIHFRVAGLRWPLP